jgi:hypothetical protein
MQVLGQELLRIRKMIGLSELSWKVQLRQQQQKEKKGRSAC